MGWITVIVRVFVGVAVIFAWKEIMKPSLLKFLPHLFRVIEQYGFILPRKFFMPASEYQKIPSRLKVDNVMPSVSDLPGLLTSIRHPGRGRSVSVGPQSAADAYETLAYREKRRRDSLNAAELESAAHSPRSSTFTSQANDYFPAISGDVDKDGAVSQVSGISASLGHVNPGNLPTPAQSRVGSYEQMMGQGHVLFAPATPPPGAENMEIDDDDAEIFVGQSNELDEKEMFSRLEKPRVRYDVEVVTKLVVYAGKLLLKWDLESYSLSLGIGWLAVELNPIIFELLGLGMGHHRGPIR
jgi:hypothetical protein